MSNYNPNKHHRRSIRLAGYDYSQAGLYFVTLVCQDRAQLFGDIKDGIMYLNEFGQIAADEWLHTQEVRNNVVLHEFVVMPNHIHGIIQLLDIGRGELHSPDNNELHSPDNNELHLYDENNWGVCKTPLRGPSQTIGAIVRGYKSSVTKQINLLCAFDAPIKLWQRNYYDHIIRNEQSYQRISEYIFNNPAKWKEDKFYKK